MTPLYTPPQPIGVGLWVGGGCICNGGPACCAAFCSCMGGWILIDCGGADGWYMIECWMLGGAPGNAGAAEGTCVPEKACAPNISAMLASEGAFVCGRWAGSMGLLTGTSGFEGAEVRSAVGEEDNAAGLGGMNGPRCGGCRGVSVVSEGWNEEVSGDGVGMCWTPSATTTGAFSSSDAESKSDNGSNCSRLSSPVKTASFRRRRSSSFHSSSFRLRSARLAARRAAFAGSTGGAGGAGGESEAFVTGVSSEMMRFCTADVKSGLELF